MLILLIVLKILLPTTKFNLVHLLSLNVLRLHKYYIKYIYYLLLILFHLVNDYLTVNIMMIINKPIFVK